MITKLIDRLILVIVLCFINLVAYAEVMDLKGKYYEEGGCIYLIGQPTKQEKLAEREHCKERMAERTRQVEAEIQRGHELKIERIKAQAMRDYLIAQDMPLREVAEAVRKMQFNQRVNIGDIISKSTSSTGKISNSLSNKVTNTNKNTSISDNKNTNKN